MPSKNKWENECYPAMSGEEEIGSSTNNFVICTLERFFYRWGKLMATYPLVVIVISLTLTGLCCIGFKGFRTENDAERLWLPRGSQYLRNKEWKRENWRGRGGPSHRYHVALISHEENIMTPEGMLELLKLSQRFKSLELHKLKFPDFCALVPITDITLAKRRRRKRELWHYYKTDGPRRRRLRKTYNNTAANILTSTEPPNTFKASTEALPIAAETSPSAKKIATENAAMSIPQPQTTTGATEETSRKTLGMENIFSKVTSAPSTTPGPSDDYNDIFYEDYIDFYEGGDKNVEDNDEVGNDESTEGDKKDQGVLPG